MTDWNISAGSDTSTFIDGLPSHVDNDIGTIRAGGTISDTAKWQSDSITLGDSLFVTISSGNSWIEGAYGAGAFNAGTQVIRSVTNSIAGVTNNVILNGTNSANRDYAIKKRLTMSTHYYKTAIRTNGWSEFSGAFSPAVVVLNSGGWDIAGNTDDSTDLSGTDHAANPTAATPGELVYRDGSATPNQDDYKAKTAY